MDPVQELTEMWEAQSEPNIETLTRNALTLIQQAQDQNLDVPSQLYTDIVLSANYAFGFGGKDEEATVLFDLLKQVLNEDFSKINKIYRLICTAFGSLITIMSGDEQASVRHAPKLFLVFDLNENATRIQIVRKAFEIIDQLLGSARPQLWTMELLSFYVTFSAMLNDFDELLDEEKKKIQQKSKIFKLPFEGDEEKFVADWKNSWIEKSDYFRFVSLMIFTKHGKEETWGEIASSVYL